MDFNRQTASAVEEIVRAIETLLTRKERVVVAIDGRCGSGKTTLAALLAAELAAVVIHADDFFLRPEQRTPDRLAEAGGNMDRERLRDEVLLPLQSDGTFTYRPFDCSTQSLQAPVTVAPARVVIVEGSYSCHPELWAYSDLHIFVTVSPDEQIRRITARNGAEWAKRFAERWIPMEERYFDAFAIKERCEITVCL